MDNQFKDLLDNYSTKNKTYYYNPRTEMVAFIPEGTKKILDIGCSTGGFGLNVKNANKDIEIWGIEPYENAANEAIKVLDHVIHKPFEKDMPELGSELFDVIVFNDVLEHLVNPGLVLQDCQQYLSPNGVVVASIPNILFFPVFVKQILIKEDWKYTLEGIFDNTHLRFFTKKSIVRLFYENGYSIELIKGINGSNTIKFKLVNFFSLGKFKNWKFQQFAVVAKKT